MAWQPITKVKQKDLARKSAKKAFGNPSNYQVGQARKILMELVNSEPKKYLEYHEKYVTPNSDLIIQDTAEQLISQMQQALI